MSLALRLLLSAGLLAVAATASPWDIAVAGDNKITFFARNKTILGEIRISGIRNLKGLAYDPVARTMYVNNNETIASLYTDDAIEGNFTFTPLYKSKGGHISGIAFDASSRTLYWSDMFKNVIMRQHVPLDDHPGKPVVLHNLTNTHPWGIGLDPCNRYVYWINSSPTKSIERSNFDGGDRTIVVESGLQDPAAVTVDHADRKLYWIDDTEGIHFAIERSDLNGGKRECMTNGTYHEPLALAVDEDSMYWIDRTQKRIWMAPKKPALNRHTEFFPFKRAAGIISRVASVNVDCARANRSTNESIPAPVATVSSYTLTTVSSAITEKSDLTTESSKYCLNDGYRDRESGSCRCKSGYDGTLCEISLCYNYCLRGDCVINDRGLPECKCPSSFGGSRCERDVCDGYCLHNGQCSVQSGKPFCTCKYSSGDRCEHVNSDPKSCEMFCANNRPNATTDESPCRCTYGANETAERMVSEDFEYTTLLPIFASFIVILILLIAVLSYYVNKLRRRPRIKKRFVVSKGGVTPLTSRPRLPDNQCEITIENCCNMNICETPCFEPKLRTAVPSSKSNKKEEKNSLLDNMDDNSC